MDFPERIYTEDEVSKARERIAQGHKHNLTITGTPEFKHKTEQALEVVTAAGYYDFLRTYIRSIIEIDGFTQLHEADAAIWATEYTVENPVDAASFFVQKASVMKEYIEGKLYYGGAAERRSNDRRLEFLTILKSKSKEKKVVAECERLLDQWRESSLVY
jgi:hypothetical protein